MRIEIGNINLNVLESGAKNGAPALIFLHYFGGSAQSWQEVIAGLEMDHYCLAPDLRGFGKTLGAASFDLEDYAQDVIDLAQAFDLKDYILIGHSMGGKIALRIAAQKSENLRALILLAPSPPTPEPMKESARKRLLTTHGTADAAEETIEGGVYRKLPGAILRRAIEANLESSEAAWRAWLEIGSLRNITSLVEKIKVPVFAAVGEKDENMTAELIEREIVSRVPQGHLAIIKEAKHLLPLEAPAETSELIRDAVKNYTI